MKSSTLGSCSDGRLRSLSYNSFGGCSGESADVGKYAGAGAMLSEGGVAMVHDNQFLL